METALITGGARGIGRAYAEALLARGYRVALLDVANAAETAAALNAQFRVDSGADVCVRLAHKNQ